MLVAIIPAIKLVYVPVFVPKSRKPINFSSQVFVAICLSVILIYIALFWKDRVIGLHFPKFKFTFYFVPKTLS